MTALEIHPSSFAGEYRLIADDICLETAREAVIATIHEIRRELKNCGCRLIGHIKALLHSSSNGCQFFSTASFDECVHCKGHMDDNSRDV
jgi:hypothetical protein